MKVWTCTSFTGYWPTRTAAVVVAATAERAAELLNEQLKCMKLLPDVTEKDMQQVKTSKESVDILSDGNY